MIYAQIYNALVERNGGRILVPTVSWPFRAFSIPKADVISKLKTFVWTSSMAFFCFMATQPNLRLCLPTFSFFSFFDYLFCLIASLLGDQPTVKDKFSSVPHSCLTLCNPMDCSMLGFPVHQIPELAQTHVHQVGDAIQPFHPLSFPSPPAFSLSQHQGLFQWVVPPIRFSFSISPSNEYSGLIFFRIDWLDILAVQGTLKGLLQQHSSKASILWCSVFFRAQLSHPYMTPGKTIALTKQTFVGKVTSLLFNMLSRFVIAFLPRSKHLLISWLPSPSAVILEPKKIKSVTLSIVSPSICHEVMGPEALIFVLWMLSFKPAFSLSLSSRGSLVYLHFLPEGWCHLHIWGYCISAYLTS